MLLDLVFDIFEGFLDGFDLRVAIHVHVTVATHLLPDNITNFGFDFFHGRRLVSGLLSGDVIGFSHP